MEIDIRHGTDGIDWEEVCNIIRLAPLGTREPEKMKRAAENSFVVCSAFNRDKIVGFGRAISDGGYQSAIYDVVVLPNFQGFGVGKLIMDSLLEKLPRTGPILIYVVPGKQSFYRKFGFRNLKTGMGLFPDPNKSRGNGYLE